MPTTVDRLLPTEEAEALLELTRELATKELAPQVHDAEEKGEFPAAAYAAAGQVGADEPAVRRGGRWRRPALRGLPPGRRGDRRRVAQRGRRHERAHPDRLRGRGQRDASEQRATWLPRMLGGEWLGAYCLSEPQAGSDVSAIKTKATLDGDAYVVSGTKQWISNGSCADYYILFARTGDDPTRGLTAFIVPADTPGMSFGAPEKKMGLACDVTTQVLFDGAADPGRPAHRRGGRRHEGRALRARLRPARHRCRRHRHRPGRDGPRGGLRPRAQAVRPGDRGVPGTAVHARGAWRPRSSAPARRTSTRRGSRTPAAASPARPASPS